MRIFCFSGSGNSFAVARELSTRNSINPELVTQFKGLSFIEVADSEIGIVAPVYFNDIPIILKEFLMKLSFIQPTAYIFAVLTSGSGKNKNGFKNIELALAQCNARLSFAYDIQMPSSYQARADMDSLLGAVPAKITEIAAEVVEHRVNYTPQGSTVLPKGFARLPLLNKPLARMRVTEDCTGCGLCCKLCPADNIELHDGKATRANKCIACTACANWCPNQAIISHLLKGQYRHPETNVNDLQWK